ncbi:ATP-binding protein [Rugamonas rubra]|uniref:Sensory/regulatory protein RpfC n=1 Tax=Rugamonas rubra TaxID=758825 RepID=A0A1I4LHP6_9BURK|nr:ATP-binding protein [Rugamonas rubra]SFL90333.1 PAS domain S-box-containing protein [Rugamonas rubra]
MSRLATQRRALELLAIFAGFFLLALSALWLARQPGSIAILWNVNALLMATLLTRPGRAVALLGAAGLAIFLANCLAGVPAARAVLFVPPNLLESLVGAWLLGRRGVGQAFDHSPEQWLTFLLLGCCVPPLAGASLAAWLLPMAESPSYLRTWSIWYAGSTVGSASALPLLLLVFRDGWQAVWRRVEWPRLLPFALSAAGVCVLALVYLPFSFIYMVLPLMMAAVTLSLEAMALLVWLVSLVMAAVMASPYFAAPPFSSDWQVLLIYAPMLLTLIPPLLLAVSRRQERTRERARLQAEVALDESHRELQVIIDNVPAMIGYWTADERNRFANRACQLWFGMDGAALRGQSLRAVLDAKRYGRIAEHISAVLAGETRQFELQLTDPEGAGRQAYVSFVPDRVAEQTCGFYSIVTDITALKQAQLAEHAARKQLQAIIDSASEFAIIATDSSGLIEVFSTGAERMLGYRAQDMEGRVPFVRLHEPGELSRQHHALAPAEAWFDGFGALVARARHGVADRREWTLVRQDGSPIAVDLVMTAIRDQEGAITGFLGIAHDTSAQRQLREFLTSAKEQAEQASQAKSSFLANMSHEIRTPLNAVLGLAQLLEHTALSAVQRDYLTKISGAGHSLLGILNDVLDFSKIEAGRMELYAAPYELDSVLTAVAGIIGIGAADKPLRLIIDVAADVPQMLEGDAPRLQQILINLCGNAIKFTERGRIVLSVKVATAAMGEAKLVFSVMDTGIGMDQQQQQRLFTAFSQVDGSMTRRFGGTGLGLAISRRLVELMEGTIDLTSTPGGGSTFAVRLPLRPSLASPREAVGVAARVLLIDRDNHSRAAVAGLITRAGGYCEAHGDMPPGPLAEHYDAVLIDSSQFDPGRPVAAPLIILANPFDPRARVEWPSSAQLLARPVTQGTLSRALRALMSAAPADAGTAMEQPSARLAGIRILLAEDNALNQLVACELLRYEGALIDVVDDGQQAIERLRGHADDYALVLMDVQMPVMDGVAATQVIRHQLGLTLPILAMTAGVLEIERHACLQAGMNDFIAKPLELPQMLATILRWAAAPPASTSAFDVSHLMPADVADPQRLRRLRALVASTLQVAMEQAASAHQHWEAGRFDDLARGYRTLRATMDTLHAEQFASAALAVERAAGAAQGTGLPGLMALAEQRLRECEALAVAWCGAGAVAAQR